IISRESATASSRPKVAGNRRVACRSGGAPMLGLPVARQTRRRRPMIRSSWMAALVVLGVAVALPAWAQTVKVTPLGGIDGEFCPQDRALVFEDPNGTRVLYDPGRTVAGPNDPRLGKIDVILVSHMHGDHVGNAHNKAPNSGSCEKPDTSVSAVPNSN